MSASEKNVALCGGGLVGTLAACYLGKRKVNVDLYEYRDDVRKMKTVVGRSINMAMSVRGREALRKIGCEDLIVSHGIEMHSRMLHDTKGNVSTVKYDKNGSCILSIDRRYINELLLTEAEKYETVKIHYNHKLVKCSPNNGDLVFYNTKTKEEVSKKTDLIVGCDGAYSVVRQNLLKEKTIDYQQQYISSYYLELRMPPTESNEFAMPVNYLHIWPRGDFMLIALPNQDKSFTCTLFMPNELFLKIKTHDDLFEFFEKYFKDVIPLIGKTELIDCFFNTKPSPLISVKCDPHHGEKCVLIGDAAHAMVPFYGQGMNCAFEDCIVFFDLFDKYGFENLNQALSTYSLQRVPDAHAIVDLAMYNYIEMRYLVTTKAYKLRKFIDNIFYTIFPKSWIPLYTMVTFSRIRYSEVVEKRKKQDKFLKTSAKLFSIAAFCALLGISIQKFNLSINYSLK